MVLFCHPEKLQSVLNTGSEEDVEGLSIFIMETALSLLPKVCEANPGIDPEDANSIEYAVVHLTILKFQQISLEVGCDPAPPARSIIGYWLQALGTATGRIERHE